MPDKDEVPASGPGRPTSQLGLLPGSPNLGESCGEPAAAEVAQEEKVAGAEVPTQARLAALRIDLRAGGADNDPRADVWRR